jgi:phosphatidylglycerophosphatase A
MSVKAPARKGKRPMQIDNPHENSPALRPPRWPLWLITLGGSGLLRPAPGTWGSLTATLALWGLHSISGDKVWPAELGIGILILGAINVWFGKWILDYFGRDDPGACVIDEGAGMCLTLLFLPIGRPWITFLFAFAAFRLFDVLKPPPAKQLENLPLGWGILMDDLAAAVYANLLCQLLLRYAVYW